MSASDDGGDQQPDPKIRKRARSAAAASASGASKRSTKKSAGETAEEKAQRQAERQRAYRDRLKNKGLVELRIQIPTEFEETARTLVERLVAKDPILKLASRKGNRWALLLPGLGIMTAIILGAAVIGGVFSAVGINLVHSDELKANRSQVETLEKLLTDVTHERDQYEGRISALLAGETRDRRELAQVQRTLRELSSQLGSIQAPPTPESLRGRLPTPPGPRLVPAKPGSGDDSGAGVAGDTVGKAVVYRFQDGDTLRGVAAYFGVDEKRLRETNEMLRPVPWRYGDAIVVPTE